MRQFNFNPVNEGEVATYTISFMPTNSILNGMNIYIQFPLTFDQRLGNEVNINVVGGLTGSIQTNLSNRVITISNFDSYYTTSPNPVQIVISGVINPNKPATGNSGYLAIGTFWPNTNTFVDYLQNAGSVLASRAAGWYFLLSKADSELHRALEPLLKDLG